MSNPTDTSLLKHLVTLAAIVFGWFLGETTSWFKKRWSIRNLRKSLLLEIEDALDWLKRNQLTIEHIIQLTVLGELIDLGPIKVPTHIYDNYFHEISTHLTRSERVSYNSIYQHIHLSYKDSTRLVELIRSLPFDNNKRKEVAGILDAMYHNVSMAITQIQYHLANRKHLDVSKVSSEQAKQMEDAITAKLHDICSQARQIGLEEVKRRYYNT
jgi:hypothetical protein